MGKITKKHYSTQKKYKTSLGEFFATYEGFWYPLVWNERGGYFSSIVAPQAHFVQERAGYLGSPQKLSGGHDIAGLHGDMDEACSLSESFLKLRCVMTSSR